MEPDASSLVCEVLGKEWPDFKFKKAKRTWAKESCDRVLRLIQFQRSRWSAMYYLNFGVYYLDLRPIVKPMLNLPKQSDWHLFSRYEAFRQEMTVTEQNDLFSLEDHDPVRLNEKCHEIGSFCKEVILPRLEAVGNILYIEKNIEESDVEAFYPFNTQRIAKKEIVAYAREQSPGRRKSD